MDPQQLLEAARLLDNLENARLQADAAFREGYELGYRAGFDVGYGQAEHEMAEAWKPVADYVHTTARQPTHAELQRRRAT